MENKKLYTMSKVCVSPLSWKPEDRNYHILEDVHHCYKFRRYLPVNTKDGGNRKEALIQFFAREGGQRTVREGDIVDIR